MPRSDTYDQFVCPECHTQLALENRFLICDTCGRCYPIDEHDIPHLLIAEGDKHRREKR